ncbi:MAG: hypothetical protein K6T83_00025 [Alicyclobacillus sp.]|nr:hypothetical protein [Alicyclobacillus sp.]
MSQERLLRLLVIFLCIAGAARFASVVLQIVAGKPFPTWGCVATVLLCVSALLNYSTWKMLRSKK